MLLWANAFAARNRVAYEETHCSTKSIPARDISLSCYLPNTTDYDTLRERLTVIVGRIACHPIPYFKAHLAKHIPLHISHEHTNESLIKSDLFERPIKVSKDRLLSVVSKYVLCIHNIFINNLD